MAELSANQKKVIRKLGLSAEEAEAFGRALLEPQSGAHGVIWTGERPAETGWRLLPRPSWLPAWADLVDGSERPGQSEWQTNGACYVLDPGSLWAASAVSVVDGDSELFLDVCAAPGGKTVAAWRALHPGMLVANEVVPKRRAVMAGNLIRCGVEPVWQSGMHGPDLKEAFTEGCDVVLVDAPCSGQSLVARGQEAPGAFHPAVINTNANRQKKILAFAAQCVRQGGWLLYMTCTFSPEENEEVVAWLLDRIGGFEVVPVPSLAGFESGLAEFPCYRHWPHVGPGAGSFVAALRRVESVLDEELEALTEEDLDSLTLGRIGS